MKRGQIFMSESDMYGYDDNSAHAAQMVQEVESRNAMQEKRMNFLLQQQNKIMGSLDVLQKQSEKTDKDSDKEVSYFLTIKSDGDKYYAHLDFNIMLKMFAYFAFIFFGTKLIFDMIYFQLFKESK